MEGLWVRVVIIIKEDPRQGIDGSFFDIYYYSCECVVGLEESRRGNREEIQGTEDDLDVGREKQ